MIKVKANTAHFHLTLKVNQYQFFEHIELGNMLQKSPAQEMDITLEQQIETKPIEKFIWLSNIGN